MIPSRKILALIVVLPFVILFVLLISQRLTQPVDEGSDLESRIRDAGSRFYAH